MTDRQTRRRRPVSAAGMTRLEGWASRKPCIALMGEFSAGKTTLTNLLVGEDVLPTRVTATQLPPVWMSYGEPRAWYVDTEGQRHDLSFDDLHGVPVDGVRYIRLFCKGRILETIDLIDTPGISDPNIPKAVWEMAVGYVNAVIWCTHSTQAWRESERSAWESLPERLRENSVLLATRSDKLLPAERERVARRLRREAGDMFRNIIMFSAQDALRAASAENAGDLWSESGGEALLAALHEVAHGIIETRKGMLSRYAVIDGDGVLPSRARPVRSIRPNRVDRDEGASRPRLSRNDADSLRSRIMEDESVPPAPPVRGDAEVLHLSFALRVPKTEEAERHQPDAEPDRGIGDGASDAAARDAATVPEMDQACDQPDDAETDAAAALADTDDAGPDDSEAEGQGEVEPQSAARLWREVVAGEPEVRTVQDVIALFEKFLIAVDRAEGIEPEAGQGADGGLRRHG